MRHSSCAAALLVLTIPALASAQNATTPGDISVPHPTLEHISIEWAISGDDNEDGAVSVRFREQGAGDWRSGLPLVRVPAGSNEGLSWANRHAGSLFALTPDTAYEIELTLSDPDGGSTSSTVNARTRPVPTVPADARIVNATPETVGSLLGAAEPGDVVLLGPGTYGDLNVGVNGSPGAPVVLRGSDVENVIVAGEIRMDGRSHVWVEDVTVQGQIKFNNASGIVVRGCHIEASLTYGGHGIVSLSQGSTDGYIADNVITGHTSWTEASLGVNGDNIGEGIWMTGPGNVIEHNRVVGFRDCISLLEGDAASYQVSVDILRNDVEVCSDDAIEADFAMGNVRVIQNRMTNTFIALSSQPSLGGPTWFIRNVTFNNIFQAFKPQRGSVGDIWYHNTVVKSGDAIGVNTSVPWSRATFRNNLLIGGGSGTSYNGYATGAGRVLQASSLDVASADFDYDGFGSIGTGTFSGRFGDTPFDSLAELRDLTTEAHAVEVNLEVFAQSVAFPADPFPRHDVPDLRLADGAATDVGQALPNINDGFSGAAPDLGAYELGSALPPYGPRVGVAAVCGDLVVQSGESCDDGNTAAGDGCDGDCQLESDTDAGPSDMDAGADDGGEDGAPDEDGGGASAPDAGARGDGGTADGEQDGGAAANDRDAGAGTAATVCACGSSGGALSRADLAALLVVFSLPLLPRRRRRLRA